MTFLELSHIVSDGLLTYPGLPTPSVWTHLSFEESHEHYADGTEFYIGGVTFVGNTGTYLDAPIHRHRGGLDVASLPLDRTAELPGVTISSDRRGIPPAVMAGRDLVGKAVLFHTGHAGRWGTGEYFTDHPFLLEATAHLLVEAGVGLVGIDSLNVDATDGRARPVHTTLLGAGIPIVEHLTGLEHLPEDGFTFTAVPAPISGMASMPVRAYANVPG